MRVLARMIVIAATAALLLGMGAGAPPIEHPAQRYYLSLGDSLAFGFQPDRAYSLDFNPVDYHGYAEDYAAMHPDLTLVNLGCPGETSASMLGKGRFGRCPWILALHDSWGEAPSQAAAASAFLQAHQGEVDLITVDIGSNDLLALLHRCQARSSAQAKCVRSRLPATLDTLKANYGTVLGQLTTHAPSARIVLFSYYNPLARQVRGSDRLTRQASQVVEELASRFHATVADAFTAINQDPAYPTERASLCALTWQCSSYADVHPTSLGYRNLAEALRQALR